MPDRTGGCDSGLDWRGAARRSSRARRSGYATARGTCVARVRPRSKPVTPRPPAARRAETRRATSDALRIRGHSRRDRRPQLQATSPLAGHAAAAAVPPDGSQACLASTVPISRSRPLSVVSIGLPSNRDFNVPSRPGAVEQLPVAQVPPSSLDGRVGGVLLQVSAERHRHALVNQDPQAAGTFRPRPSWPRTLSACQRSTPGNQSRSWK